MKSSFLSCHLLCRLCCQRVQWRRKSLFWCLRCLWLDQPGPLSLYWVSNLKCWHLKLVIFLHSCYRDFLHPAKYKMFAGWNLWVSFIFLFLPLQVIWWAGPWRIWISSWPCRMAVGSRTWCFLLPTSSSLTTWKALVSWLRRFRTGQHASLRVVSP